MPFGAGVVAAIWVVLLLPAPAYFVHDADGGIFIQGAYDWRVAGLTPQIDVHSSYGPLSFASRAFFQAMLGDRIIAEVALAAVGYGVAYGVLYSCFRALTGSVGVSWLLLASALLCLPRFYKFPVVLIPALAAWSALRLIRRPVDTRTAVAAGITLGIAFLFRVDYFIATAVVVGVGWARRSMRQPAALRRLPMALVSLTIVVLPWLLTLAATRGIFSYAADQLGGVGSKAVGMGLPHPLLVWDHPVVSALFACAYSLVVIAVLVVVGSRRTDDAAPRDAAWIGAAAGMAFLPQSMHRTGVSHLLQVVPGCLLALASVLGPGVARRRWAAPAGLVSVVVMLGLLLSMGRLASPLRTEAWGNRLRAALLPAPLMLTPEQHEHGVIGVLRTCAPEGTSVAVYPFAPQLAYFAGRVHGGAYLVLAPGYYDDAASLAGAFDTLRRDRVSVVLWDEDFAFDGRPERRSLSTHATLHRQLTDRFVRVGRVDRFTVYVDPASSKAGMFVQNEGRCR